jgi:hypothetical protein
MTHEAERMARELGPRTRRNVLRRCSKRCAPRSKRNGCAQWPARGDTQTAYLLALAFDLLPERSPRCRRGTLGRKHQGARLASEHGLHRHQPSQPATHARRPRTSHIGCCCRTLSVVALSGETRRHHDLGTLERLDRTKDGFFNPHMNSFNHYSLGSVGEWLFRHVAGIELDPERPGFQRSCCNRSLATD